jgi:UDP-2,3-diacylglucosamine hydrolase
MPSLLISDLHLSPYHPEICEAFFNFLRNEAADSTSLYILGDLFEAWIGDDDQEPLSRQVISSLKSLTDKGVAVYLMPGNRDFLYGKRFVTQTGCKLLLDYHVLKYPNKRVLLLHGDILCTEDKQYQRFRYIVRSRLLRFILTSLPISIRQKIAKSLRSKSIALNTNKPENIMDVSEPEVERLMKKYDANIMIHGHTHRPRRHQQKYGERIVLGDWDNNGWYIRINNEENLELLTFKIKY